MKKIYNKAELKELATSLAQNAVVGDVFCLEGDLGAGKTTFSQYFINAISTPFQEVTSPTFNIVQCYPTNKGFEVWHFDLYRLSTIKDVYNAGIEEALYNGVSVIEWPDIALDILDPSTVTFIRTEFAKQDNLRYISITKPKL